MTKPRVHLYDFERTALDGCRVLCGRHSVNVKWVGRPDQTRRPLCAKCLEQWHDQHKRKERK